MENRFNVSRWLTVGVLFLVLSWPPASAAGPERSIEHFYKGKMVRIIVGYTPGGAFDTYSRLVARNIPKVSRRRERVKSIVQGPLEQIVVSSRHPRIVSAEWGGMS